MFLQKMTNNVRLTFSVDDITHANTEQDKYNS